MSFLLVIDRKKDVNDNCLISSVLLLSMIKMEMVMGMAHWCHSSRFLSVLAGSKFILYLSSKHFFELAQFGSLQPFKLSLLDVTIVSIASYICTFNYLVKWKKYWLFNFSCCPFIVREQVLISSTSRFLSELKSDMEGFLLTNCFYYAFLISYFQCAYWASLIHANM